MYVGSHHLSCNGKHRSIQGRRQVFMGGGLIVVGGLDPRYDKRGGGVLYTSGTIRKAGAA